MDRTVVIEKTISYIQDSSQGDSSGHDWWHVYRVWNTAKNIAIVEGGDEFVIEVAALLHDLDDHKFSDVPSDIPELAEKWLLQFQIDSKTTEHILSIIAEVSFKGANVKNRINSLEGMIVQDADRLDAIGAIGIARAFAYGGYKGHLIYDPNVTASLHNTFEEYKSRNSSSINHFYEKLLLLKDKMNTSTGKKLAQDRHNFMEFFLRQFFIEWDAKDILNFAPKG
jgi:uncharacterized protein